MGREKNQENMGMRMGDSEQRNMGIRTFPRVNSGVKRIRALSDTLFLSLWGVSAISGRGKSDKFLSLSVCNLVGARNTRLCPLM